MTSFVMFTIFANILKVGIKVGFIMITNRLNMIHASPTADIANTPVRHHDRIKHMMFALW
jgi:hypothetical protein